MLRVKDLSIFKVGPFEEEMFDFSIQKGHPDVHIFTGTNGSGKTSILHSIASGFDFYPRRHAEYLSNLLYKIFHKTGEGSNVKVRIEAKDKEKYGFSGHMEAMTYKCKECANVHLKLLNRNKKPCQDLVNYKDAIASEDISNKTFKFAVFGYSGYRFISSAKIKINSSSYFNPLNRALEFVKKTTKIPISLIG